MFLLDKYYVIIKCVLINPVEPVICVMKDVLRGMNKTYVKFLSVETTYKYLYNN